MTQENIGNEVTDTSDTSSQASKTYTQEEVDNMIARMKGSIIKKYEKQYGDLGDPEELRALKSEAEKRRTEEQMKRGEFEKTLQELAAKKDAEIQKRDAMIRDFKLNTPLLETAATMRAVKPEQVRDLLKGYVTLSEDGEPVVTDGAGKIRYSDKGTPLSVSDLVQEFLTTNPHFVSASPATTNTKSNHVADSTKIDITKLDMRNPKDREKYKKLTQNPA